MPPAYSQTNNKVCTSRDCSTGCVSWTSTNDQCSPGTQGTTWRSSILSPANDGRTATWRLYQDTPASQTCGLPAPGCSVTLKVDGSCHTFSMCGNPPTLSGSYRVTSVLPSYAIALIVLAVVATLSCVVFCK